MLASLSILSAMTLFLSLTPPITADKVLTACNPSSPRDSAAVGVQACISILFSDFQHAQINMTVTDTKLDNRSVYGQYSIHWNDKIDWGDKVNNTGGFPTTVDGESKEWFEAMETLAEVGFKGCVVNEEQWEDNCVDEVYLGNPYVYGGGGSSVGEAVGAK